MWVVPGDARRWSCRGSNALLRNGATALIQPEDLLATIGEGPWRSGESRSKHQRLMEVIGSEATFDQLVLRLQCSPAELAPQLLALGVGANCCVNLDCIGASLGLERLHNRCRH